MIGSLVQKLLKRNEAPDWFCADKKRKIPESEIKAKIRYSIQCEVSERAYDCEFWNEEFITKVTNLYFKFFDQLYMQSA